MLLFSLFVIIFLPSTTSTALAASSDVIINEIAWMGTTVSANDEWLELFNNTTGPIILDGWILKSADEKLKINLKGVISARGFYLLERTDDTTVPNITADLIYKGALSNTGEDIIHEKEINYWRAIAEDFEGYDFAYAKLSSLYFFSGNHELAEKYRNLIPIEKSKKLEK